MILLPAELADVLKTVQNNENGKDIFFPDGNEDLIAELAAAWDRWNEAADGHVQGIVQAAQRAMASMSGPAADSFAQYLQKFASGAGSHVATTLQAGQGIAQSLHGAAQAVTGTKNEMIRELQYAKEYMASHPAGKKSDIAQSEGVKQAAAVYHQYIGQVGSNVDGMLRQSADHITEMTGMAKTCALNGSNGGGAGAGGPAGGPGTGLDGLTPPPGADGGAGSGSGGSGLDGGGAGGGAAGGAGGAGSGGPGGLGQHGGAGLGRGKTPAIQPFKPLTPAMPTIPDFTSGSGKLPVYSPLPLSPSGGLSLAGLSGPDTGSALGGGSGSGALSPFGGAGGGAGGGAFGLGGSGGALAGGTAGAAANGLGGAASAVGRAGAGLLSAAGSGRGAGPGGTAAGAHGPGGMGGGGRGGAGKDGKKGNRFLSPSRFGAEIEDEDLPKTDRGILGQAAETDPRDRKWQQARRRWLDDARADGALTAPETEAAPAETPVTPASENDALALLAGVLRGTDDTDGTADDGPGDTATAAGGEGARTQDATTTSATDRDDAYLDRARTAAARRGHPDAPAAPDVATTSTTTSVTPTAAAAEAKPAPIREEGGYQVPSPFLRAALTRLAAPTD